MNLFNLYSEKINKFNQKLIVTDDNNNVQIFTSRIILKFVEVYSSIMMDNGLKRGDIILLIPDNSIASIAIFFAALKIGVITSFAPIKLNTTEINNIRLSLECSMIFCSEKYRYSKELYMKLESNCHTIIYKGNEIPFMKKTRNYCNLCVDTGDNEPVSILYTSGSSGNPLGVMLSYRSYINNVMQIGEHIKITFEDIYLQILPFYYIAGQITSLLVPLYFGASIIISNSKDPKHLYQYICKLKPTVTNIVPTLLYRFREYVQENNITLDEKKHSLRLCLTGGSSCSEELLVIFRSLYHINVVQGYGSTEGGCGICIDSIDFPSRDSVGKPLFGHQLIIKSENGKLCNAGEVGEIFLKNNVTMLQYYKNPEKTRNRLINGWLRTGDLGFLDKSGSLHICGRTSDFFKRGGEKIFLSEIENLIRKCKFVKDCQLIIVNDIEFGEIPLAFISLINVEDEGECNRWINKMFSKYKRPILRFLKEIPLNSSGKVDINLLKKMWYSDQHFEKG